MRLIARHAVLGVIAAILLVARPVAAADNLTSPSLIVDEIGLISVDSVVERINGLEGGDEVKVALFITDAPELGADDFKEALGSYILANAPTNIVKKDRSAIQDRLVLISIVPSNRMIAVQTGESISLSGATVTEVIEVMKPLAGSQQWDDAVVEGASVAVAQVGTTDDESRPLPGWVVPGLFGAAAGVVLMYFYTRYYWEPSEPPAGSEDGDEPDGEAPGERDAESDEEPEAPAAVVVTRGDHDWPDLHRADMECRDGDAHVGVHRDGKQDRDEDRVDLLGLLAKHPPPLLGALQRSLVRLVLVRVLLGLVVLVLLLAHGSALLSHLLTIAGYATTHNGVEVTRALEWAGGREGGSRGASWVGSRPGWLMSDHPARNGDGARQE